MVSIKTLEKKPRLIYHALLLFLAFLVPLGIYEIYNGQYMFFALEAIAFAFGVAYALKYRRAFSCIELYRSHLTLVRGGLRKDVPYDSIRILEEMGNYLASLYIGPKEHLLIHSNHFPGMKNDDAKRTVNILGEEIRKRTGERPSIKYR